MERHHSEARDGDADARFDHDAALSHYVVNRFLVHQLLQLGRSNDGDFDSLIILSVLQLQAAAASIPADARAPTLVPDDLLPEHAMRTAGLRSSDIAQISGIPRETVRRKLERMQAKGRVIRHDSGRWHAATATLAPQWQQITRDIARNVCATAQFLRDPPKG